MAELKAWHIEKKLKGIFRELEEKADPGGYLSLKDPETAKQVADIRALEALLHIVVKKESEGGDA